MRYFHFSFFGILLYSIATLLLSPFQKEMLSTQTWQLQSIKSKQTSLQQISPGLISDQQTSLSFHPDGRYTTASYSGTWTLRGKILTLHYNQASFSFRISQLSKENLLLQTRVDGVCVSLLFFPQLE